MGLNDLVHVSLPGREPLVPDLFVDGAFPAQVFRAGDLGGFAKTVGYAHHIGFVDEVTDGRIGTHAGSRVGLTALVRDPKIRDRALFAGQFGSRVQKILCRATGIGDSLDIAVLLDREPLDRLAGFGDPIDDSGSPPGLDTNHHDGCDVRIGASANQGSKM